MEPDVHATGTCDRCGEFRVEASALTIRLCVDTDQWSYRLRCPNCGIVMLNQLAARVARHALLAGATLETWTLPVDESESANGHVLSQIDLSDLLVDLERTDLVDALRESLGS